MGNFEIIATQNGEFTLKDRDLEEKIHPSGPLYESYEVYVKQSGLEKALHIQTPEPVILFDVGLGIASNASAAFKAAHRSKTRGLKIISFENDLTVLEYAYKNMSYFNHLQDIQKAIDELLKNHFYEDEVVSWRILNEDLENSLFKLETKADFIFHDPYSPKKTPSTWEPRIFERYYKLSKPHCVLVTYSQATHVRQSLKSAGFFLGHGMGFGQKRESTVAARHISDLANPII